MSVPDIAAISSAGGSRSSHAVRESSHGHSHTSFADTLRQQRSSHSQSRTASSTQHRADHKHNDKAHHGHDAAQSGDRKDAAATNDHGKHVATGADKATTDHRNTTATDDKHVADGDHIEQIDTSGQPLPGMAVALMESVQGKADGKTHIRQQGITLLGSDGDSPARPLLKGALAGHTESARVQPQPMSMPTLVRGQAQAQEQGQHATQADGRHAPHQTNGHDARQATLATTLTTRNGGQNTGDATARMVQTAMAAQAGQGQQAAPVAADSGTTTHPGVLTGGQANALSALQAQATTATPTPQAHAQSPLFTAQLNASVGSDNWNQALQQQALRLSHFGDGHAKLTLYPRELGQIQVSLQMGQQAQLHFVAPNVQARAAIQQALPQLQQAFADNGIDLGQASVSDQSNPQSDSRDQQQSGGHSGQDIGIGQVAAEDMADAPLAVRAIHGRTADGGIDLFA